MPSRNHNSAESPSESLRDRRKNKVREQILEAATELFLREGVHQVSLRRIAAAVSYTPMALYAYFQDKQALIRAVAEHAFQDLESYLTKDLSAELEPVDRLRTILRRYVAFAKENPRKFELMFYIPWSTAVVESVSDSPEGRKKKEKAEEQIPLSPMAGAGAFEVLTKAVSGVVPSKKNDPRAVLGTSLIMWSAIHGIASLIISMPSMPMQEMAIHELIETVISGSQLRGSLAPSPVAEPKARKKK